MAHLLDSLPSLQAITFIETSCVAWSILETVFARSRITSLTFSRTASFKAARDYPPHDHPPVVTSLTAFVYTPKMWRELANFRKLGGPDDLNAVFSHEAECLASLIPSLRRTIVRLTLPFETAPLRLMAAYHWPKLQELSLFGRYRDEAQVKTLQDLLSSESLTEIQKLSIQVARSAQLDRPFILGHRSAPSTALSGLRSLTVAYPHPDDDLFSIDTSHLHHLSLRDWPRYYTHLGYRNRNRNRWAKPLLSPAECLSILRRMNVSQLTSLELAYLAPSAGFDDELLDYVATSLSNLTSLELHRYREDRSEPVDHVRLSSSLRVYPCMLSAFPASHRRTSDTYEVSPPAASQPRVSRRPRTILLRMGRPRCMVHQAYRRDRLGDRRDSREALPASAVRRTPLPHHLNLDVGRVPPVPLCGPAVPFR